MMYTSDTVESVRVGAECIKHGMFLRLYNSIASLTASNNKIKASSFAKCSNSRARELSGEILFFPPYVHDTNMLPLAAAQIEDGYRRNPYSMTIFGD